MKTCDVCGAPIRWRKFEGRWVAFVWNQEHKCPGYRPAPQPVLPSTWQPRPSAEKVALSKAAMRP